MPYIVDEYRERVNPALYVSVSIIRDYVDKEEAMFSILSQLFQRYIYNDFSLSNDINPAWDAKNRAGLPDELPLESQAKPKMTDAQRQAPAAEVENQPQGMEHLGVVPTDQTQGMEHLGVVPTDQTQGMEHLGWVPTDQSLPSPPTECDLISNDVVDAFSGFDEDAIEGVLNFFVSSLLGMTICTETRYCYINRSIGILRRVAGFIGDSKHWGVEGVRLGRSLGVLSCVEDELYRRLVGPYEDKAIAKNGDIPFYQR